MREENFLNYKKGDGTPSGNPDSISIGSQEKFSTLGQAAGQQGEPPAATSLLMQCVTRLRGIVEALNNIHNTSPQRWSTDLDDVHSSAESLLSLIKDQAPTQAAQGLAGGALAQPSQAQAEQAEGAHVPDEVFAGVFAEWWEEEGQYCRAGGGDYERTFAFQAWRHLYPLLLQARAALARVAELEMLLRKLSTNGLMQFSTVDEEMAVQAALGGAPVAQAQHSMPGEFIGRLSKFLAQRGATGKALLRELRDMLAAPAQAQHSVPGIAESVSECMALAQTVFARMEGLMPRGKKLPEKHVARRLLAELETLAKLAAAPGNSVPQAWLDVQAERRRQITAEGWTPEHDDEHSHGQMARASACYALAGSSAPNDGTAALLVSLAWPWDQQWWKPSTARRDLIKAGALILAEIERIDRVAASQGGPSDA